MPAPATTDDFLQLARQSGLIAEKDLHAYLEARGDSLPDSPNALAVAMVRDGLLTKFQAGQFLKGKWRGFVIAGKYKLLEHLGSGGMASVFLCEHVSMHRRVAIKMLPPSQAKDPGAVERFYREARAVAALDHANLVRAHDIDHEGQLHFLVMEYVDGNSLQDIIRKHGPLSIERAVHYVRQAAAGLHHAHLAGLVHRDVKPGNILVDRSGTVKVLDLGLARFFHDTGDEITKKFDENCVLGTADYCAPEQALNSHSVDIRADIYSLGATLSFCLTGRTPFGPGTTAQKIIWHQMKEPQPIRELRPGVPEGLAAVLAKMMAKDVGQRYQTPADVMDALAPWDPEELPPPPEDEMPQLCPRSQGPGSSNPSTRRRHKSATAVTTRAKRANGPPSGSEPTVITPRSSKRTRASAVLRRPNVALWAGVGTGAAVLLLLLIVLGVWWARRDRTPSLAGGRGPVSPFGIFENESDVGTVLHPGSFAFDAGAWTYTVAGSGENLGANRDDFHYVWKKTSGDLALTAEVSFLGAGQDPHRKACLVIRQGLEADAACVTAALDGDGLTALQFREARGAATHQIQANVSAPSRLRLEKRGRYALLYLAGKGEDLQFSGAAVRLPFAEPFYVGLGVCAHNKDVTEKAVFSNVELSTTLTGAGRPSVLYSTLETQTVGSTDRRVVHVTPNRMDAPNWLRDGTTLIFNGGGRIHRIPAAGGRPEVIDTGFATRCNNDHGVSPDGTLLVIGDQSQGDHVALMYTLPVEGGMPKLVTPVGPSYWHGWSPDGKTLVYCGERDGEFDVFSIPAAGGEETRLTADNGPNDGPEFSPDGRYVYFNSRRTGRMQIWRMRPDGSEQEQVTFDDYNNWFPHPSPDGLSLVFLSYEKDVTGHPDNKDVTLRRMSLDNKRIEVLGRVFGGQGTINAPCWSPNSQRIAFVTYQLIP